MSSRGYGLGITGILLLVVERIIFGLAEFLWRELLILIRIPFEIFGAFVELFASLDALRTNLDILSAILNIYHNFTSGLPFPQNILHSVSPMGTLIWIGFWCLVFWYIGIPALGVLFSILTDHR